MDTIRENAITESIPNGICAIRTELHQINKNIENLIHLIRLMANDRNGIESNQGILTTTDNTILEREPEELPRWITE